MKKKADNFADLEEKLGRLRQPAPSASLRRDTLSKLGLPSASPSRLPAAAGLAAAVAVFFHLVAKGPLPNPSPAATNSAQSLAKAPANPDQPPASAQVPAPAALAKAFTPAVHARPANSLPLAAAATQAGLNPAPMAAQATLAATLPQAHPGTPIEVPQFAGGGGAYASGQASAAGLNSGTKAGTPGYSFKVSLNKFRPSAGERMRLNFHLEKQSLVKVNVFDARGMEAAVLFNGNLPAGPGEIAWDGGSLPSGAYTLLFEAGQKHERVQALLIR